MSHDPLCQSQPSWVCDCEVIAETRRDERKRTLADAARAVRGCRDGYVMAIGASPTPPERYWIPRDSAVQAVEALGGAAP